MRRSLTKVECLADDADNPAIVLIDCRMTEDGIVAELGFISQGLSDRPYSLFPMNPDTFRPIDGDAYSVRLPKGAIRLPEDLTCKLDSEIFNYDH